MARLSEEFLADLKSRVDVESLLGRTIALKKNGQVLSGLCPFHQEKTPSFRVYPEKGNYHCFGCGAHGSAIDFLMETQHMEFRAAVEELASMCGMSILQGDPQLPGNHECRSVSSR